MLDLEYYKERFRDHVASLKDYGDITVLDFKKPGTVAYRIRFLFENDYGRLHISGDMGELTACDSVFTSFNRKYVDSPQYFQSKVKTHDWPFFSYSMEKARNDLKAYLQDIDYPDNKVEATVRELLAGFDHERGLDLIGQAGELLSEIDSTWPEWAGHIGQERTGIIELYLMAFSLAWAQLVERKEVLGHDADK